MGKNSLSRSATTPKTSAKPAVRSSVNMAQSPAGPRSGIGKSSIQGGYKNGKG